MKVKGFSLIELMVVIAIVAVLAAVAVPSYKKYQNKAKLTNTVNIVSNLADRVKMHMSEKGAVPTLAQLNIPDPPNTIIPNSIFWNDQGANGKGIVLISNGTCNVGASISVYLDAPIASGLSNAWNMGINCNVLQINGAFKKDCGFWLEAPQGTWISGQDIFPAMGVGLTNGDVLAASCI